MLAQGYSYAQKNTVAIDNDTQNYLLEFIQQPLTQNQHAQWITLLEGALVSTHDVLVKKKLLTSHRLFTTKNLFSWINQPTDTTPYDMFFTETDLIYPQKISPQNRSCFGSMRITLPEDTNHKSFLSLLNSEIKKKECNVRIIPDIRTHSSTTLPESFAHISFDRKAFNAFKNRTLQENYQSEISSLQSAAIKTTNQLYRIAQLSETLSILNSLKQQLFWHHTIPTTGLILNKTLWNNNYPFLPHRFPLWQMAQKLGEGVTIGVIDNVGTKQVGRLASSKKNSSASNHGSYVAGIIAGQLQEAICLSSRNFQPSFENEGICGIAPRAHISMIRSLNDSGEGHLSEQVSALIEALSQNIHIINMSFKSSDFLNLTADSSILFETLVNLIPYCIAASGNNGDPQASGYPGVQVEGYPARFKGIAFDVGAFAYDHTANKYPIASFSQFQQDAHDKGCIGPKFVAPGYNIISCGSIDRHSFNFAAAVNQGTSMAAPLITGFVALMLSEFPDDKDFTRQQLLKVCYASGIKMHNSLEWNQKSIFGSLDMRTALFTLHVLRDLKKQRPQLVSERFDVCVKGIHVLLFGMANTYSEKKLNSISFKDDFIAFYAAHKTLAEEKKPNLSSAHFTDFKQAKEFCVKSILYAAGVNKDLPKELSKELVKKISDIFTISTDLFKNFPTSSHNRISELFTLNRTADKPVIRYLDNKEILKLNENVTQYYSYWETQTNRLKSR